MRRFLFFLPLGVLLLGCEKIDHTGEAEALSQEPTEIATEDLARLFAELPLGQEQFREVFDAVSSSSANGYDEEYMLRDLFAEPGSGVGDAATKAAGLPVPAKSYSRPIRDLITEHLGAGLTKSAAMSPEEYVDALESSDFQVYWPYQDDWDGSSAPIITYDPGDGSSRNFGYECVTASDGSRRIETVIVDEEMARKRPVWVINRNDDSGFTSLEMLRRQDPDWGTGGGEIIVGPQTKSAEGEPVLRTLILKDFCAHRNYDSWLAGASEFFVKIGAVEDFFASTEAELRLYTPSITDFMIVVKRKEVGLVRPFNAVLVSRWTEQLDACAFMITEDDGGAQTEWKCTADVKLNSKVWGVNLSIPFRSRDDIVWRGQLSSRYFEKYNDITGHFGDVDLTFEITEL